MSNYTCPNCDGGFPEPEPSEDGPRCPWCHQPVNGEYVDTETDGFVVEEPKRQPNPEIFDGTTGLDDLILNNDPATTSCPECGEDMPLVTWTGKKPKCRRCQDTTRNTFLSDSNE